MTAVYLPGEGIARVASDMVLLVSQSTAVDSLLEAASGGLPAVLDHLLQGGIAGMPHFACWERHGERVRLLLRGDFSATVGGETWDAVGAATWIERVLPITADEILLSRIGVEGTRRWPVAGGVVYADLVSARADGDAVGSVVVRTAGEIARVRGAEAAPSPRHAVPEPQMSVEPIVEAEAVVEPVAELAPAPEVELIPDAEPEAQGTSQPAAAETITEAVDDSFDELFGRTVIRTAEDAAVRIDEARPLISAVPGMAPPPSFEEEQGVVVAPVAAPAVRLEFSTGQSVDMAGPVVVGRAPQARNSTGAVPRLVVVDSPQKFVSSTHLEFLLEDGRVVVKDVSSNGTLLTRPGAEPQRLPSGQQVLLTNGCELTLGDDVVITVVSE